MVKTKKVVLNLFKVAGIQDNQLRLIDLYAALTEEVYDKIQIRDPHNIDQFFAILRELKDRRGGRGVNVEDTYRGIPPKEDATMNLLIQLLEKLNGEPMNTTLKTEAPKNTSLEDHLSQMEQMISQMTQQHQGP